MLGGQRQIALVLAILVIDHHHHSPRTNLRYRAGNVGKGCLETALRICHGYPSILAYRSNKRQRQHLD